MSTTTALVIFPVLSALALKQTGGNAVAFPSREAGVGNPYVGIPAIDDAICGFVTFFHIAFTPPVRPVLHYFLENALVLLAIPALEAARPGRHYLLGLPVLYGLAMQLFTVGAVLPIYWLVFILTNTAKRTSSTGIPSTHAQAVAFGIFIGAAVPSACLILLQDSKVTALWQLFPVWQFVAQSAHLLVRRSAIHESGFPWIQALYLCAFVVSSSIHIATLFRTADLQGIFVPSMSPRVSASTTLQVLDLLQWDMIFAFASTLLGTVWLGRTRREVLFIALWNVVGSAVFGPGAAIAAVALWRESCLHAAVSTRS
ncbi:Citreoviridin biosynthesis protein D [Mycena kentingensis (nom. inval.)]|nr:Citreoviridin biosynthesis protein D [Mycena kentingensis (nom. inval.)]